MKKQYFLNANIIDPHNSLNEVGGLIISENGTIEAVGKKLIKIIYHQEKKQLTYKVSIYFQG